MNDPNVDILSLPVGDVTLGEYLCSILEKVWRAGDLFSSRYGLTGSTGWQLEPYRALIQAGLISGSIDSSGTLEDPDTDTADELICAAIRHAFHLVPTKTVKRSGVLPWD